MVLGQTYRVFWRTGRPGRDLVERQFIGVYLGGSVDKLTFRLHPTVKSAIPRENIVKVEIFSEMSRLI
jgi:hypothetical protein